LPRSALAVLLGALALLAAGCGTGGLPESSGDVSQGRDLFVEGEDGKQPCGSCHTLKAAGARGTIGPNLDDAFGPGREQGFQDSTIASIVADQIRYPAPEKVTDEEAVMPADLVTGDNVDAVATFIARCAGNADDEACASGGDGKITATGGKEIFAEAGCGGCHTLAAAGTTGTVGPNLDDAKPSKALVVDRVTNGKGAMPPFRDRLTKAQINAVAEYVSSAAGK
jgi:cbb3-type cytochrome c oxidase subunit III